MYNPNDKSVTHIRTMRGTEIDARYTGRKMSKYIKSKAFTPSDWASDIYMKIRTFFAHKES